MQSHPAIDNSPATNRSLAVLITDDAIDFQQSVRGWLQELGHDVISVSSGDVAVDLIQHQAFDLVITEVILPDVDGLEVINAVRKAQPSAHVIAVSAGGRYLSAPDCLRVAKGLGAHEVLLKPVGRDELLAAVASAVATPFHRRTLRQNEVSTPAQGAV